MAGSGGAVSSGSGGRSASLEIRLDVRPNKEKKEVGSPCGVVGAGSAATGLVGGSAAPVVLLGAVPGGVLAVDGVPFSITVSEIAPGSAKVSPSEADDSTLRGGAVGMAGIVVVGA